MSLASDVRFDSAQRRGSRRGRKSRLPVIDAEGREVIHGIIWHGGAHYDEMLARRLLEEYGEKIGRTGLVFTDDPQVIEVSSDEEANAIYHAKRAEGRRFVQLGVGSVDFYSFNEHRPGSKKGRDKTCCAELVALRAGLLDRNADVDTFEYVGRMVTLAKHADMKATQHRDQLGRMLKDLHRAGKDSEDVYRWVNVWFTSQLEGGKTTFNACKSEFESFGATIEVNGITVCYTETEHVGSADKYLMSPKVRADIVVVRNRRTGNVAIKLRHIPDSYRWYEEIAVELCREEGERQGMVSSEIESYVAEIRQFCRDRKDGDMPGVAIWYMHKRSFLNGSESHRKTPTTLDKDELFILIIRALERCPERTKMDDRRDEVYKLLNAALRKMEDQGDGAYEAYWANWLSIANLLIAVLNLHLKLLREGSMERFSAMNLTTVGGIALSILRKVLPDRVVERENDASEAEAAVLERQLREEAAAETIPSDEEELQLSAITDVDPALVPEAPGEEPEETEESEEHEASEEEPPAEG